MPKSSLVLASSLTRRAVLTAGLSACLFPSLRAATYPIDDSASVVHRPLLDMQWRAPAPGAGASFAVDARTTVGLSLDTRRWAGRHGRVFMALAPQPVRCVLSWTTGGRLAAGRLEPGQRTLVYEGQLPALPLTDTLVLHVTADGRELQAAQQLRIGYDVEVA